MFGDGQETVAPQAAGVPKPPPLPPSRQPAPPQGKQETAALPQKSGAVENAPLAEPLAVPAPQAAKKAPAEGLEPMPDEDTSEIEEVLLPPDLEEKPATGSTLRLIPPPGVYAEIRIALLLPLTGPHAALGASMQHAAEMALFDIAEKDFSLMPYDTKGTDAGARAAAIKAVEDGVELILGPVFAASVAAVAPEARRAGVPVVGFSTDRSVAGNGVFLLGFLPKDEIDRIVGFARSRGHQRFAALVPNNAYGTRIVEALGVAVGRYGGAVVRVARYNARVADISDVVRRLANYAERKERLEAQRRMLTARDDEASRLALKRLERYETLGDLPFDAILLPEGGDRLKSMAPLLPFYDIDPVKIRLLGTSQWDDPSLGTEPALVGGWFAASPPKKRDDFIERYKQIYGTPPLRLATLAYDATALAAVLSRSEGGADFSISALTAPNGFDGIDGIFRLDESGLAERGLSVLQMERNRVRVLSPALTIFPGN
ncbi:MAG: penicillin-binding protein activator [Rhodospirillaceae bacterium]|nr:penicillin-binding protein activator [Rhodospirillaceae bacterium]MBT5373624.1 penicillin-binding protein activator [Rhodospirillaceae bacterium]